MDNDPTTVIVDGQLRYDLIRLPEPTPEERERYASPEYRAEMRRQLDEAMRAFWAQTPKPPREVI
jgi:hypothetical protein